MSIATLRAVIPASTNTPASFAVSVPDTLRQNGGLIGWKVARAYTDSDYAAPILIGVSQLEWNPNFAYDTRPAMAGVGFTNDFVIVTPRSSLTNVGTPTENRTWNDIGKQQLPTIMHIAARTLQGFSTLSAYPSNLSALPANSNLIVELEFLYRAY